MIMSSTVLAPDAAHAVARPSRTWQLGILLKAWWAAHKRRRTERLAAARLRGMSDRELKDIGVMRAEIDFAVQRGTGRGRRADLGLRATELWS
jgi:uncharacterized protein YjiS (DUF1127 family)